MRMQCWLGGFIAVLALSTLTCSTLTGPGPDPEAENPVTPEEEHAGLPTPPATARVAFVATGWSVKGADREIFLMNPDGSGITSISNSRGRDEDPAWSPDGSRIAFVSDRDGNYELYIMNADGSGQRRITETPQAEHYPTWSPDGASIAFSRLEDNRNDLFVMRADGSGLRQLTSTPANERYPDWSPDGETILFSRFGDGTAGIYRMDADGSGTVLLQAGPLHNPQWSPDGHHIAFDGEPAGCKFEVYIMNADGSGMRAVTDHPLGCGGYDKHPTWSPDGRNLIFWSSARDPQNAKGGENLFVVSVEGSGETQLTYTNTTTNYGGFDADWSPIP